MNRKTMPIAVAEAAIAASIAVPVAAATPTVKATVTDGTLRISGSPRSDKIALRLSALDANQLQVDVGDDGSADKTFDITTLRAIDVEAGNGNDTFIWDPGDGSDVVEGGRGSDTLVFNGSAGNEIMAATAVGERVSFTRNLGNIVMDLDGIEGIDVRALGGTDTVTVNDVGGTDRKSVV